MRAGQSVGGGSDDGRMGRSDETAAVATRTVRAWQLRPGWIVIPVQGAPRRVASYRLEGVTPTAIVEFVGIDHRITYPAAQPFTVEDVQ